MHADLLSPLPRAGQAWGTDLILAIYMGAKQELGIQKDLSKDKRAEGARLGLSPFRDHHLGPCVPSTKRQTTHSWLVPQWIQRPGWTGSQTCEELSRWGSSQKAGRGKDGPGLVESGLPRPRVRAEDTRQDTHQDVGFQLQQTERGSDQSPQNPQPCVHAGSSSMHGLVPQNRHSHGCEFVTPAKLVCDILTPITSGCDCIWR